jgi:hypothetical protein
MKNYSHRKCCIACKLNSVQTFRLRLLTVAHCEQNFYGFLSDILSWCRRRAVEEYLYAYGTATCHSSWSPSSSGWPYSQMCVCVNSGLLQFLFLLSLNVPLSFFFFFLLCFWQTRSGAPVQAARFNLLLCIRSFSLGIF